MIGIRFTGKARAAGIVAGALALVWGLAVVIPARGATLQTPMDSFTTGRFVPCVPGVAPCLPTPVECAMGIGVGVTRGYTDDEYPTTPPPSPVRLAYCDGGGGHIHTYLAGYVALLDGGSFPTVQQIASMVADTKAAWLDTHATCGTIIVDDKVEAGGWTDPNLCSPLSASPGYGVAGRAISSVAQGTGGVVASISPIASQVGVDVLNAHGNAMDAAVATTLALGVTRPEMCSIGGVGQLVYRTAGGDVAALDFMGTAPEAATADTIKNPDSGVGNGTGHRFVAVPGVVAGLSAALDRYGTMGFGAAARGAIRLATQGVPVRPGLATRMVNQAARLAKYEDSRRTFLTGPDGQSPWQPDNPAVPAILRMPDLAHALQQIADNGPNAFYSDTSYGDDPSIGRLLRTEMNDPTLADNERPATWSEHDLTSYRPVWHDALAGSYRGDRVFTVPPSSAGGVELLEMLNILERHDLGTAIKHSSADYFHLLAEALKIAEVDSFYIGDPAFAPSLPTDTLISKEYAARRDAEIAAHDGQAADYTPGPISGFETPLYKSSDAATTDSETAHISVIDRAGNAAAITCTLGQAFGSALVARGTGFALNDELPWFRPDPLGGNDRIEGGKRAVSPLAPTIVVRRGRAVMATGAAGGDLIPEGVLVSITNTVDFGMDVAHAVDAARSFEFCDDAAACPWGDFSSGLLIEDSRVLPSVLAELQARGHSVRTPAFFGGEYMESPFVQAVVADPVSNLRFGASDPRDERGAIAQ